MKLEGVFLDSRLGRRIFILFVVAATVPITLLGALAYSGWTTHAAAQDNKTLTQATRFFAMTVLDRLRLAREALRLGAHDASGESVDKHLQLMFRWVAVERGPAAAGAAAPAGAPPPPGRWRSKPPARFWPGGGRPPRPRRGRARGRRPAPPRRRAAARRPACTGCPRRAATRRRR